MALPKSLINQFAKVTNDNTKTKKESIVYGTIPSVGEDGKLWVNPEDPSTNTGISPSSDADEIYVHLDGSYDSNGKPKLVKINTTVKTAAKDRVIISIRNHMAVVTGNLTTPSTTVEHVTQVETTITDTMKAKYLNADQIKAAYVQTTRLESDYINAEAIQSTYATIDSLNANYGEFTTLKGDYAGFKQAYTEYLNALNTDVYNLDAYVAHINELMFGSATGESLHSDFANAIVALIGTAQIESAMIKELEAEKLTSGSINTDKVSLSSDDGSLVIFNDLIQIKEGENVRVQIGKDASGKYSIVICDNNGATMFDVNGISKDAIKSAIIVNDMVADNANISGKKLDIQSLINEINENGSTTIKSSKIKFDGSNQTLDVAFTQLNETVSGQGTAISANSEAITNKVWKQDIDKYAIGGRNLLLGTDFSDMSLILPWNQKCVIEITEDGIKHISSPERGLCGIKFPLIREGCLENDTDYVLSFSYRTNSSNLGNIYVLQRTGGNIAPNVYGRPSYYEIPLYNLTPSETEWQYFECVLSHPNMNDGDPFALLLPYVQNDTWFEIKANSLKFERGSNATAWCPALEELSTKYSTIEQNVNGLTSTVANHESTITETEVQLSAAQTVINQLSDAVSMLVTDSSGSSLMTQTEDGWTFSTAKMQSQLDDASTALDALVDQCGNTDAAVEVLQHAVSDLGVMADYIKIGTYEDEPCIELGEGDSNFKLLITNTRIMFMDGSDIPAYINNKSLYIKKAVIEEELQQGGYSWVTRSNGHLSLVWKGVTE